MCPLTLFTVSGLVFGRLASHNVHFFTAQQAEYPGGIL
jgi:hypothetical protein